MPTPPCRCSHGDGVISPGTRLGSYEIVSLLGSGGMGDVYRARDTKLGRGVAIKMLPKAFIADEDRRARFEREARLLAALNRLVDGDEIHQRGTLRRHIGVHGNMVGSGTAL